MGKIFSTKVHYFWPMNEKTHRWILQMMVTALALIIGDWWIDGAYFAAPWMALVAALLIAFKAVANHSHHTRDHTDFRNIPACNQRLYHSYSKRTDSKQLFCCSGILARILARLNRIYS
jgi:hypothetical protein